MPFPVNMVYVRWEFGWQPSGAASDIEIQDFGIWGVIDDPVQPPFPGWTNVVDGLSQRAANAWCTNMNKQVFANAVKFRRAVCYHYSQDHQTALDRGESAGTQGTPWAGSGGAIPPENSTVVSLFGFDPAVTVPQMRRKRGRIYMPTPSTDTLAADGRLNTTTQTQYLDDLEQFWGDLTGTFDNVSMRPVVSSTAGQMTTDIQFLRVGLAIDTQRRRRNRIPESYATRAV